MSNISITLNIDPSTNPELATAVTAFFTALATAGHLEGIQITSEPGYNETDFVTIVDVIEFLKSQGLKNPLDKAQRIWWNFQHGKFHKVNSHILIICNACLLTSKNCACNYHVRRDADIKIGVQSLLSSQRINFAGMSTVSKERLEGFIEHVRETHGSPAATL